MAGVFHAAYVGLGGLGGDGMVYKVPLFLVPQNKALAKIHKTDRLYIPRSGSYTACFIVKISQKYLNLDFIVANYLR